MYKFIICFIAGIGAGLGTGFAGMSAAAVITPMLVTFLGVEPYTAVGIALASDVLASAVSAYTYQKSGNLDIKNSLPLMISVLTGGSAFGWAGMLLAIPVVCTARCIWRVILTERCIPEPR